MTPKPKLAKLRSHSCDRRGVVLRVEYNRISPSDARGMVEVESEGAEGWIYACTGTHHGAQCELGVDDRRVVALGEKIASLVREHFGAVRPLLDEEVGRRRAGWPTAATEGSAAVDASAGRFVSDYADNHLYLRGDPQDMCAICEHYRAADGDPEDWCWLKEGKYADGRENECPAWIASQRTPR